MKTTTSLVAILVLLLFFALSYGNCKFVPIKEFEFVTVRIYFKSGRQAVKTFKLPTNSNIYITNYERGITYLRWTYIKPFSNDSGALAFEVEDFEIIEKNKI